MSATSASFRSGSETSSNLNDERARIDKLQEELINVQVGEFISCLWFKFTKNIIKVIWIHMKYIYFLIYLAQKFDFVS